MIETNPPKKPAHEPPRGQNGVDPGDVDPTRQHTEDAVEHDRLTAERDRLQAENNRLTNATRIVAELLDVTSAATELIPDAGFSSRLWAAGSNAANALRDALVQLSEARSEVGALGYDERALVAERDGLRAELAAERESRFRWAEEAAHLTNPEPVSVDELAVHVWGVRDARDVAQDLLDRYVITRKTTPYDQNGGTL